MKTVWTTLGCGMCATLFAARALAATYYASPTAGGSACSVDAPCALDTTLSMLKEGDTLLLRGGTYQQKVYIGTSGTEDSPIVVSSYPGEVAVIDGDDRIPASDWGVLLLVEGSYVTIQDLEVKNSLWMGVKVGGDHSSALRVTSHDNWENGILLTGDYTLADGCFVYNNARSNENCVMTRDSWASGLSAARAPVGATIRGSTVWHNWGEGISTYEATQTTIEDNAAYDNFSVNLYVSDATHVLAQRNVVYATGAITCNASQLGIAISSEAKEPSNSDITLINNAVYGTKRNFYYYTADADGMVNTLIAHNAFVNSTYETNFKILAGAHSNTRIVNNIILQEDSLPVCFVESNVGLTFSHNLWSSTPCAGSAGDQDVVADPKLEMTGSTAAGMLTADWFRIQVDSPARDSAAVLSEVSSDIFQAARGTDPDMGVHEYGAGAGGGDKEGGGGCSVLGRSRSPWSVTTPVAALLWFAVRGMRQRRRRAWDS